MPLEIWIPESARPEPRQVLTCTLCGKTLPREQRAQFIRHAKACYRRNEDKVQAELARRNENAFTGSLDPERESWIREQEENRLVKTDEEFYNREGIIR